MLETAPREAGLREAGLREASAQALTWAGRGGRIPEAKPGITRMDQSEAGWPPDGGQRRCGYWPNGRRRAHDRRAPASRRPASWPPPASSPRSPWSWAPLGAGHAAVRYTADGPGDHHAGAVRRSDHVLADAGCWVDPHGGHSTSRDSGTRPIPTAHCGPRCSRRARSSPGRGWNRRTSRAGRTVGC